MFRASLRSISDPLRDHVCLSCLARRFSANTTLRRTYTSSTASPLPSDNEPANGSSKAERATPHSNNVKEIVDRLLQESKIPSSQRPRKSKRANALPKGIKPSARSKGDGSDKPSKNRPPFPSRKSPKKKIKGTKAVRKPKAHINAEANALEKTDAERRSEEAASPEAPSRKKKSEKGAAAKGGTPPHLALHVRQMDTGSVDLSEQKMTALDIPTAPVPRLSFGLERVLFNPGVYHLRDFRSRVYNFDPYLGSIMPVTEFDFAALKDYITSSKDELLREVAVKEKKKYVGSSSSMTSVLSHFHYLLSAWRPIDTRTLSQGFPDKMRTFTRLLRSPAAMFLRYQDGVYAIDADKEFDTANILMNLGKSMEKLLTLPKEDFERYRRSSHNKISAEEEQATPESYHYTTAGDFIMRSQLDAYDPRLPGSGMFDLKTRAVVSIRMDARNFEHGLGYEIKGRFGAYESYEREFFDMIRAAFLKYSLQVRIGRMDGIFVAFHNIERIFGFQYVSLPEMDQALHGQYDTSLGDAEFKLSLALWNKVLDKATTKFPKQSLRFHFEARDTMTPFMYIFAEPVTDEEIHQIQTKNQAEIDAYQKRILNLEQQEDYTDTESSPPAPSDPSIQLPESEQSEGSADSSSAPAYDSALPRDESFTTEEPENQGKGGDRELLAMTLLVRNNVNGVPKDRPTNFSATDNWTVDYELTELDPGYGRTCLKMCQNRRQKALIARGEDAFEAASNVYIRRLRQMSRQGRAHRERENQLDREKGVVVLTDPVE